MILPSPTTTSSPINAPESIVTLSSITVPFPIWTFSPTTALFDIVACFSSLISFFAK